MTKKEVISTRIPAAKICIQNWNNYHRPASKKEKDFTLNVLKSLNTRYISRLAIRQLLIKRQQRRVQQ